MGLEFIEHLGIFALAASTYCIGQDAVMPANAWRAEPAAEGDLALLAVVQIGRVRDVDMRMGAGQPGAARRDGSAKIGRIQLIEGRHT